MKKQRNFDLLEAAVLLNVYLISSRNGTATSVAVCAVSSMLRRMAVNQGYEIDDQFRSETGIHNRYLTIANMYQQNNAVGYPRTDVFEEVIYIYHNEYSRYRALLRKALTYLPDDIQWLSTGMERSESEINMVERTFWSWLSNRVDESLLNELKFHFPVVNAVLIKQGYLKNSILTIEDASIVDSVAFRSKNVFASPKLRNSASRLLKEYKAFLLSAVDASAEVSSDSLIEQVHDSEENEIRTAINQLYPNGIRFDDMVVHLLEEKVGRKIDSDELKLMQNSMFCRRDGLCFFPELICNENQSRILDKESIIDSISACGCIDLMAVWRRFIDAGDSQCLRDEEDLEKYLAFRYPNEIRFASALRTKIARETGVSVADALKKASEKLVEAIDERSCVTQEDLQLAFPFFENSFTKALLEKYTDEVLPTVINDFLCYQTIDSLGFDDSFREAVNKTLNETRRLSLSPTSEVIHAILSVLLGVNIRQEYSVPDDKTFRRIISKCYSGDEQRTWKNNVFTEVLSEDV